MKPPLAWTAASVGQEKENMRARHAARHLPIGRLSSGRHGVAEGCNSAVTAGAHHECMIRIYEVTKDGRGPWAAGDRVAYSPFRKERSVVVTYRIGPVMTFGRNMTLAVRRDAASGALRFVEEILSVEEGERYLDTLCGYDADTRVRAPMAPEAVRVEPDGGRGFPSGGLRADQVWSSIGAPSAARPTAAIPLSRLDAES
jgi:hypothetical protein